MHTRARVPVKSFCSYLPCTHAHRVKTLVRARPGARLPFLPYDWISASYARHQVRLPHHCGIDESDPEVTRGGTGRDTHRPRGKPHCTGFLLPRPAVPCRGPYVVMSWLGARRPCMPLLAASDPKPSPVERGLAVRALLLAGRRAARGARHPGRAPPPPKPTHARYCDRTAKLKL